MPPTDSQLRICLFGGTFDPIHEGHIHIAKAAVNELGIDKVIFIPCQQSPHKKNNQPTAARHRLAMCRFATDDLPWATVDDFELTSSAPSYSWKTVEEMLRRFPSAQLYWLMGTDQWDALPRWSRSDYLAEMLEFIVFHRGNPPAPRAGYTLHSLEGSHPASGTQIRAQYPTPHVLQWLNPDVRSYIDAHNLYST